MEWAWHSFGAAVLGAVARVGYPENKAVRKQ